MNKLEFHLVVVKEVSDELDVRLAGGEQAAFDAVEREFKLQLNAETVIIADLTEVVN